MRPFQPTVVRGLYISDHSSQMTHDVLLEVDSHDNQKIILGLLSVFQELFAVRQCLFGVVDGTWAVGQLGSSR